MDQQKMWHQSGLEYQDRGAEMSHKKRGAGKGGHQGFIFKTNHLGWGDGSVDKALAMQCKDLTSNSQNSQKASVAVSICDPMDPVGGRDGGQKIPKRSWASQPGRHSEEQQ